MSKCWCINTKENSEYQYVLIRILIIRIDLEANLDAETKVPLLYVFRKILMPVGRHRVHNSRGFTGDVSN